MRILIRRHSFENRVPAAQQTLPHGQIRIVTGQCPVGQIALFYIKNDTVFLYRKNKSGIYIYRALCYYVFGEDWELLLYFL